MTVIYDPAPRHRCSPPRYRPESEWRTDQSVLAFMAKPVHISTPYPVGTVWQCGTCRRLWYVTSRPPPRYGYSPAGGVTWRRVRWYHRKLRRRVVR